MAAATVPAADTGTGIPADELPCIFERFWRGQAGAQTSGTGIGLAIAAELARAHGGTLTAASRPGEGTRLTLAPSQRLSASQSDQLAPGARGSKWPCRSSAGAREQTR